MDQSVARVIRDTPCDCITLKLGVNVQTTAALSLRTLRPAVIGFIQTVRDGHPDTPIVVVSPILCRPSEAKAPVGAPQFLSMPQFREQIRDAVGALQRRGDQRLFYRDGLELLGKAETRLLYDGVHPRAEGHRLMGRRLAELEFGPAGRLLPGRFDPASPPEGDPRADLPAARLAGAYLAEVPGSGRSRIKVASNLEGVVAHSDRPDWPPAILDIRGDMVFLRSSPGTWGKVEEGGAVRFNNGIVWTRSQR